MILALVLAKRCTSVQNYDGIKDEYGSIKSRTTEANLTSPRPYDPSISKCSYQCWFVGVQTGLAQFS